MTQTPLKYNRLWPQLVNFFHIYSSEICDSHENEKSCSLNHRQRVFCIFNGLSSNMLSTHPKTDSSYCDVAPPVAPPVKNVVHTCACCRWGPECKYSPSKTVFLDVISSLSSGHQDVQLTQATQRRWWSDRRRAERAPPSQQQPSTACVCILIRSNVCLLGRRSGRLSVLLFLSPSFISY